MHRWLLVPLFALLLLPTTSAASKKALFDNTKAETAGNADWVIDDNQPVPVPDQSGIGPGTARTYWLGAISSWGVDLVKRGYTVATLTSTYGITYQNASNPYDLSKYDVFIVDEPNILFTSAEATAILNYVRDGGGLVAISDHGQSDRNNDGYDSPMIWNAMDPGHLLGVRCAVYNEANNNISQTSTNVNAAASDSITRGPEGNVTSIAFYNGTTFTLYPAVNPSVRGEVWMNGLSQTSTTGLMAASSVYGNGRFVIAGDSSPADDGSASPGNSSIYDGWGEATDSTFFMNATIWATRRSVTADVTAPAVGLNSPNGGETWKAGSTHSITWSATDATGVTSVDLAWSTDGGATFPNVLAGGIANSGSWSWTVPDVPTGAARVRVLARDAAGNLGRDSSATSFTIDRWIIAASAGAGGSVTPNGTVFVVEGANQGFSIAPAAGWRIADVLVDAASVGAVASYTFSGVAASHTLSATFADATVPTVLVTSPVGGEAWDLGTLRTITWTASDVAGVDSVDVDYSVSGAAGPWLPVAHGLANSGSCPWTVPEQASDSALVRVTAYDPGRNAGSAESDSLFRLVDPTAGVWGRGTAVLALARPLPNPSQGTTLLRLSLPAAGHARLEIADVSGRRLGGLEGEFSAGPQAWRWDGRGSDGGVSGAGLYFVRLATPWGTRTERLVRLR